MYICLLCFAVTEQRHPWIGCVRVLGDVAVEIIVVNIIIIIIIIIIYEHKEGLKIKNIYNNAMQ